MKTRILDRLPMFILSCALAASSIPLAAFADDEEDAPPETQASWLNMGCPRNLIERDAINDIPASEKKLAEWRQKRDALFRKHPEVKKGEVHGEPVMELLGKCETESVALLNEHRAQGGQLAKDQAAMQAADDAKNRKEERQHEELVARAKTLLKGDRKTTFEANGIPSDWTGPLTAEGLAGASQWVYRRSSTPTHNVRIGQRNIAVQKNQLCVRDFFFIGDKISRKSAKDCD